MNHINSVYIYRYNRTNNSQETEHVRSPQEVITINTQNEKGKDGEYIWLRRPYTKKEKT